MNKISKNVLSKCIDYHTGVEMTFDNIGNSFIFNHYQYDLKIHTEYFRKISNGFNNKPLAIKFICNDPNIEPLQNF